MGNQINMSLSVQGKAKDKQFHLPLTLDKVAEWIKLQEFDEYTTKGLIDLAGRYPTNALWQFRKNFNLMVNRVRAKRRKELGDESEEISESVSEEGFEEIAKEPVLRPEIFRPVEAKEELREDLVEEV
jgi:hypothetical protein